jgi:hypothetical protein
MITDILDDLADPVYIMRQFAAVNVFREKITQDTSEIFVSREGKKTP